MKATETTILNFIGGLDKAFIIPPFQRNYEWGKEQCLELFNDIKQACQKNSTHYLGNIIYYQGPNSGASFTELILIDGQQRVTSILLFLCALRDLITDEDIKNSINKRYLFNDTKDKRYRIRLKQTAYDYDLFNIIIQGQDKGDSNGNILSNYKYFIDLIKESNIEPQALYESITKVEIVDVNLQVVNDLNTVQTVFEKINSTGKTLSPSDLIRNLLLTAHSTYEQERLYNNYWVEIEKTLKNENISRFARDYLIMKNYEDVPEKNIYKKFKESYYEWKITNEEILTEMLRLSKLYAWLRFENCPDEPLNRSIKMLNKLKTEDLYPLYLLLFDFIYNSNKPELRQIFKLLSDYMLRFRIVAPSGGGNDLRSNIHDLIEKISLEEINCTYDTILYELSNSPSPSNRFPLDDEFKNKLMENVNPSYAKVLLMKIEEFETKNIPLDIDDVTIEHLMPQTLSDWWRENLCDSEEATEIQERYLNSIGNLTIVSQNYNSSFKNYPWNRKKSAFKEIQFRITNEIPEKYLDWKEENIIARNNDISNRAIIATTKPLKRERPYRSSDDSELYKPGKYLLSDQTIQMNGSTITKLIFNKESYECTRWKDLLVIIVAILNRQSPQRLKEIIIQNLIHKATSIRNFPNKDPIISVNPSHLAKAVKVDETKYYCEGGISSSRARIYAQQLLDYLKSTDEIYIEII